MTIDTPSSAESATTVRYNLRLYVVGSLPRSARAIANTRQICEEHLEGRYDLQIVDISQNPALAECEQLIAAPTLIKTSPLPLRRFIGDMSKTACILMGLDLGDAAMKASSTITG